MFVRCTGRRTARAGACCSILKPPIGACASTRRRCGTFLNGITRQRVISLLRADGVTVVEKTLRYADFLAADEIFSTGNFAKVAPVIRIDARELKPGPLYTKARKLYWDFAHAVKLAA